MKVISQGKLPTPLPPWWIGEKPTCPRCGTVIELEASDAGGVLTWQGFGTLHLSVCCPVCTRPIEHSRSAVTAAAMPPETPVPLH